MPKVKPDMKLVRQRLRERKCKEVGHKFSYLDFCLHRIGKFLTGYGFQQEERCYRCKKTFQTINKDAEDELTKVKYFAGISQ